MPARLDFDLPVSYRNIGNKSLPMATVTFLPAGASGREFQSWAIVDSGAEVSHFPADVCPVIGIPDFRTGIADTAKGIGGQVDTWVHIVHLRVFNIELNAPVAFADPFNFDYPLLGRLDVFSRFKICFRESRSVFHVATTP